MPKYKVNLSCLEKNSYFTQKNYCLFVDSLRFLLTKKNVMPYVLLKEIENNKVFYNNII